MAIVTESSGNGGGNTGSGPENEYARPSVVAADITSVAALTHADWARI